MFADEPGETTAGGAPIPGSEGVPGKDQPTPNLSTVPDQAPKPQTTPAERQKIADQLIADNKQVQYAEKVQKTGQEDIAPPARTPNATPAGKSSNTPPEAPAPKSAPAVSTTAPSPTAPTASVQMGAAPTQGAAPSGPTAAAPSTSAPNSPPANPTQIVPTEPPAAMATLMASPPSPPPLPPTLQEAQGTKPPAAPAPSMAAPVAVPPPAGMPPSPVASPPATAQPVPAPPGQPETVVISGRSPRPLNEYVKKAGISALVATIYFTENSAQVKPEDITALRQLALEVTRRGGTFRVVSIARSPVAEARAQEVAKVLIDRGVNPGRVYAGGVPPTDPTFNQPRDEADPMNRRVDVYLDY